MTRFLSRGLAALLLVAGCTAPPAPRPAPPAPVVHRVSPPDWFQQQLASARQARRSHLPKDDAAGAQAAYDSVMRAACTRVALSGPDKYQARCATLLQPVAPTAASPFACDDAADDASQDAADLNACND